MKYTLGKPHWNGSGHRYEYSIYEMMTTDVGATIHVCIGVIAASSSIHLGANFIHGENVLNNNHEPFANKILKAINEHEALNDLAKAVRKCQTNNDSRPFAIIDDMIAVTAALTVVDEIQKAKTSK